MNFVAAFDVSLATCIHPIMDKLFQKQIWKKHATWHVACFFGFCFCCSIYVFSTWFRNDVTHERTHRDCITVGATLVFTVLYYIPFRWMDGCGCVNGVRSSWRCPQVLTFCQYLQTSLTEAAHSEVFIPPYKFGENTVGFALEFMLNESPQVFHRHG